jgi:SAM-dependent methyltransferase
VIVDIGTGDGKAVLRRARREPSSLVVGIDSVAASMAEASRRAARPANRRGSPNAMFLVAGAESLPGPLSGSAHHATVTLPWGSLLSGLASAQARSVEPLRDLLREGGRLELMLSLTGSDTTEDVPPLDAARAHALADAYAAFGLRCLDVRPVTAADVERLGSSWAKRLGIPARRHAWLLLFERP